MTQEDREPGFDDARFFSEALELARSGSPSPNPHVGAVVVSQGEVVGRGYHRRPGEPHAEIVALREAGPRAKGATVYVTLEPCNHHGRTPPCSEALIAAGVANVVFGVVDPNPTVLGGGSRRLSEAGIPSRAIGHASLHAEAARLIRPFAKLAATGRPWVRLKMGMSLDGRLRPSGEGLGASAGPFWLSGAESRRDTHRLRATVDAVMVGRATVEADNPRLDVREVMLPEGRSQPLAIVVDSAGRIARDSALATQRATELIVATGRDCALSFPVKEQLMFDLEPDHQPGSIEKTSGKVPIAPLLRELGKRGIADLLVEGGSRLAGAFLSAGLVDEVIFYVAARFLGHEGLPVVTMPPSSLVYTLESLAQLGNDVKLVYVRET